MPSFTTQYVPPGAYARFLNDNLNPDLSNDYRIPVLIGAAPTNKTLKATITRGATTKDAIGVADVSSIISIGATDTTVDYTLDVDYELGTGADADKIIWQTPGTTAASTYDVNDLDFGSLSSNMVVTQPTDSVNDSYVITVTTVGTPDTAANYMGNTAIAATISVTETIGVVVNGVSTPVALASGDTRAQVVAKIQAAVGAANATVISTVSTNKLSIISKKQGTASTVVVTVTSDTLGGELGIENGSGTATVTYTAGTAGTGRYTVMPRSTRVATEYHPGPEVQDDIPGILLTIATVADRTLNERAEIVTTAPQIVKNPLEGSSYVVKFVADKASADYDLTYYTREDEEVLYSVYGDPSESNTLALGAYVAFRNLADIIGVVQLEGGTSLSHWQAAIDKLIDKPIYYVVPLTSDPLVHAYAKLHANDQSAIINRRERIVVVSGAPAYSEFDLSDSSKALNDKRVWFPVPSNWEVEYLDTDNVAGKATVGWAGAVGVASAASRRDPSEPLTRKQIVGCKPLTAYNPTQQNRLAKAGCMVIDNKSGNLRIRHQLTTAYLGAIENREASIVQIQDHVSVVLRNTVEEEYVGIKILQATPKIIESYAEKVLEGLVQQEVIAAFSDVVARQNDSDPTEIIITAQVSPVYPLNYITFNLKFIKQAQTIV